MSEFGELYLMGAPRVSVEPDMLEAVDLAVMHARARLVLPVALPIVWRSREGAHKGETWWDSSGALIEVCINAAADLSPRQAAWVVLHELKHVADGARFGSLYPVEAEDGANSFALAVTEREAPADFLKLDFRRPSMRR